MEEFIGISSRGDIDEALRGLGAPKLIIMTVGDEIIQGGSGKA